jgi:hypothetical protein
MAGWSDSWPDRVHPRQAGAGLLTARAARPPFPVIATGSLALPADWFTRIRIAVAHIKLPRCSKVASEAAGTPAGGARGVP